MMTPRTLIIYGLSLAIGVPLYAQEETTTAAPRAATIFPAKEGSKKALSYSTLARPDFPLIVRIDDKALDPLRRKDVKHQGAVDRIILGTQAIGTSWTTGGVNVQIVPKDEDASIIIRFHGNTRTKTTGYNGPAIVFSHTDTEFDCARQVVFEPRVGFLAGKPTVASHTTLVYDGFDANRRLGKRLISRVAQQRAEEQREHARSIADRDNQAEVCQAFEKELDGQLASINRRLDIARYVNALFGPASQPHLAIGSCQDCILVGFGSEKSSQKLVEFLPQRRIAAPLEIWIHSSLLGDRMARLGAVAETIENHVLPAAAQSQLRQVVFGSAQPDEKFFDVSFQQGWIVIGLQNEQARTAVATIGL